jgi:hypothetical protein
MKDTPSAEDLGNLREAITTLSARLDRVEAQVAQPASLGSVNDRLSAAWAALRGGSSDHAPIQNSSSLLRVGLTLAALVLALLLAVELVDEMF